MYGETSDGYISLWKILEFGGQNFKNFRGSKPHLSSDERHIIYQENYFSNRIMSIEIDSSLNTQEMDQQLFENLKKIFGLRGKFSEKAFKQFLTTIERTTHLRDTTAYIHSLIKVPYLAYASGRKEIFELVLNTLGYKKQYYCARFDPLLLAIKFRDTKILGIFANYFNKNPHLIDSSIFNSYVVSEGLNSPDPGFRLLTQEHFF